MTVHHGVPTQPTSNVKVWIPYAENDHLTAGSCSIEGRTTISVQSGYGEEAIDVGTIDIMSPNMSRQL